MKTFVNLTLLVSFLFTSMAFGQSIQGIATYKTQRKVDIQLDSTQFSGEMQKQMKAMMKKQFEREYTLEFTENESVYKQVEGLDQPNVEAGGMRIMVAGSGGSDVLYKNLEENRFANQNEFFGKQFLIKDAIEPTDWKLEKETKNIGEYTCFKATYTTTRTVMNSVSSDNEGEESNSEETEEEQEVNVTAWYTLQIPVKNGPRAYGGLPGLILEVSDGSETILCSKIVLNPKDGISIKQPSKGKEVNQAEYDLIMQEKMKEMNEQFQGDGRRNGGDNVRIRIRG